MHLEVFSAGQYHTEMFIENDGGEVPRINHEDYSDIQYRLYEAGEHENRVLVKVENVYLPVKADSEVECNVLALPDEVMDKLTIRNPPARRDVFVQAPWMVDMVTPFI